MRTRLTARTRPANRDSIEVVIDGQTPTTGASPPDDGIEVVIDRSTPATRTTPPDDGIEVVIDRSAPAPTATPPGDGTAAASERPRATGSSSTRTTRPERPTGSTPEPAPADDPGTGSGDSESDSDTTNSTGASTHDTSSAASSESDSDNEDSEDSQDSEEAYDWDYQEEYPGKWEVVRHYLQTGILPNEEYSFDEINKIASKMVERGGRLYRAAERNFPYPRLLITNPETQTVLMHQAHEGLIGGHRTLDGTYQKLAISYWWHGLYVQCSRFVQSCEYCQTIQRRRAEVRYQPTRVHGIMIRVFVDVVHMTHVGSGGFRYFMEFREDLSGFAWTRAVTNLRSRTISNVVAEFTYLYGLPHTFVADRGELRSREVRRRVRRMGITSRFTSPYHPQGNSLAERGHAPITRALEAYCRDRPGRWPRFLPIATLAQNCTVRRSTGYTPFEIFMGRRHPLPISINHDTWDVQEWTEPLTRTELLERRMRQLAILEDDRIDAQVQAQRSRNTSCAQRNRRVGPDVPIVLGDIVLLMDAEQFSGFYRRFRQRWLGPFVVVNRRGLNYKLAELDGTIAHQVVHRNRLKLYHRRTAMTTQLVEQNRTNEPLIQ